MFYKVLLSKANLNLPKRAPEPYGYSGNQESWEFERNNSANVQFQDNDFETQIWDDDEKKYKPEWYDDWEARFPEDTWRDNKKLNEFIAWVKSTWTEQATNETFPEPITYTVSTTVTLTNYQNDDSYTVTEGKSGNDTVYNIQFTKDTPAYRLTKFRAEAPQYMEIESATFYYLFTLFFLMIDSRAKNMFIGFHGSETTGLEYIDRKVVFEPYDMDTAIGTNNSGVLKFGYYHLDTDTVSSIISGGEDGGTEAPVYNGQGSVLWNNFREAFRAEWTSMYRTLRSTGWSYEAIERIYEEHQSMWPEALFNEDAYVKYLTPLVENVTWDEETKKYIKTDRYLTMLQGSKEQQRKWWLQNRFRYMDSMVTTGNAETSFIEMRLFNSGTLTVTMSTDGYAAVRFGRGSTTQRVRTTANTPVSFNYTVQQGMTVTEMESTIFSANLVSDVGDLSGFYGNEFDFSKATRLRKLKLGDASPSYNNANLQVLNVSNCYLLEEIDCRNCNALTQPINLEGSAMLEKAYFDGTKITSISLVEGAPITNLHLPGTIVSLVLMDHTKLTDFVCPSLANVSTLMIKNIPQDVINPIEALKVIKKGSRVNVQGIYLEITPQSGDQTVTVPVYDENDNQIDTEQKVLTTDAEKAGYEIEQFLAQLDTMKGVERARNADGQWDYQTIESGAIISGEIHTTALTGEQIARYNSKYQYLKFTADNVSSKLTLKTWDGSSTIKIIECLNGVAQESAPTNVSRTPTAQYSYTHVGWSRNMDAQTNQADALTNVVADRVVYAAYSRTTNTYIVTWKNADNTVAETDTNVPYGTKPTYNGSALTFHGQTQTGWDTDITKGIVGNTTITAVYKPMYTATFVRATEDGGGTLFTQTYVVEGNTPTYGGETPTTTRQENEGDFTFMGWSPEIGPMTANTTYTAVFRDNRSIVLKYLMNSTLDGDYESSTLKSVGQFKLGGRGYSTFTAPVELVDRYAFNSCSQLNKVDLTSPNPVVIKSGAFSGCKTLQDLIIRSDTISVLENIDAFTSTPIASHEGVIYVPANLVSEYRSDNNWKNFFIAPIDSYPLDISEGFIQDSWDQIIASANDGTYKDKYHVGDTKMVDFGTQGKHLMEIVAIDTDTREDGTVVPLTWMSVDLFNAYRMNATDTNSSGWEATEMRTSYLKDTIKPLIPGNIRNAIVPVIKVSSTIENTNLIKDGQTTIDDLWLPSLSEVGITNEINGHYYNVFYTNNSRIKMYNNVSRYWWLRSSYYSPKAFACIGINGIYYSNNASVSNYFALGFCIGSYLNEKDKWKHLAYAVSDGTYKTAYAVGDMIPFTTTDGETYNAQIVGIDKDEDAEGNKIPLTFITKELYSTSHRMNATNTNSGGWEATEMRNSALLDIQSKLPNYVTNNIVNAKKISKLYGGSEQTTYDKLWIPSMYEMGFTSGSNYEASGVTYRDVFTNGNRKIKATINTTSNAFYWTRSADFNESNRFCGVNYYGSNYFDIASIAYGVPLGFCIGPVDKTTTKAPISTDVSKAYAVEWDYSQTSPALTRKGLASSFTDPAPATSVEGTGSSPFDNIWPWKGMEVYNILPDGSKIKKGETGFSFTDNDVMVYIPEFYYTAQKDETNSKWTWAISATPIEGYEKHPGSGRYVGRYHTGGSSSVVYSRSGVSPLVNTTQTNFRTYHKNKGIGWYMMDLASWSAIQMLYLVEFANFDSQTMLGGGWNTGSVGSMGGTDSATYGTIKATGAHNQYRWIEDPFSNVLHWIDGFQGSTNASSVYVGVDNSVFTTDTTGLTQTTLKLPSSNEIKNFGYDEHATWAFIPSESVSNSNYNTYACDYVYSQSSAYPCYVGGNYYASAYYGLFDLLCSTASYSGGYIGSRPLFIS